MATKGDQNVLYYEVKGNGPAIVLLHGYLCSGKYWDTIRVLLEKHHTVITIDLLGFGKSPKPRKSSYDYDEHIAWIKRTLEHARVAGPVTLAGHSMGSLLALRYSARYPKEVLRLILLNPPLFLDKQQARRELSGTNLFYRVSIYWRLHHVMVLVLRTKSMKALIHWAVDPKYKGMEEYIFTSSGIARGRSLHHVIEAQAAFDDLNQVLMPVTIVSGRKERRAYVENVKKIKQRDNIVILFVDTTHHTPIEKPDLIADILQQK